jgi:hypothetical protein
MFWRILWLASLLLLCRTVSSFGVPRSDIHSVDFRNFDYPEIPGEVNAPIHLVNGHRNIVFDKNGPSSGPGNVEAGLESIHYGYWGTSQIEVAVVVVWVSGGGSGVSQEIFVYSKVNSQLRLIWSFDEGGERAAGGIRNVYFEHSNLVVEINEQGPDDPRCCASHFTQRFFSRTGNKIRELRAQKGIPVTKR